MAELHRLATSDLVLLSYIDPQDNDLLPINNDDNFGRALKTAKPLLRLIVQRKGKLNQCGGRGKGRNFEQPNKRHGSD